MLWRAAFTAFDGRKKARKRAAHPLAGHIALVLAAAEARLLT